MECSPMATYPYIRWDHVLIRNRNPACMEESAPGGKETTNPVLHEIGKHHAPKGSIGPGYFDRTIRRIRENYAGPVRVAQDLMRIDL